LGDVWFTFTHILDGLRVPFFRLIQLLESNVLGVLPEALPAHVQAVLADETMSIGAGTAGK
jgi:hypothetical protein